MTSKVVVSEEIYSKLMKSAERIGKLAESESIQADLNSTLSENVINVMKEEQIHRLIIPKEFGYPQIDFTTFHNLIKKVGYYNLSAAWLTFFYSVHNSWAAFLPKHRMEEIFNEGGLLADILAPVGKLQKVDGGYNVSGTWHFVSGVNYSSWIAVGAFEYKDGKPARRLILCMKTEELTIVQDWDSIGLRGSGSNTVIAENVFVPDDMVLDYNDLMEKRRPNPVEVDEDYLYYDIPYFPAFFFGFASMCLGGAERLIEEYRERTKKRVRYDGTNESMESRSQRVLADITIKLNSAEGLMKQYIHMLETDNGQYALGEYKGIRSAIIQYCLEIAVKVQVSLGAYSLKRGDVVETMVRDIITIAAHITSLYEDGLNSYGKALFGLPDNTSG